MSPETKKTLVVVGTHISMLAMNMDLKDFVAGVSLRFTEYATQILLKRANSTDYKEAVRNLKMLKTQVQAKLDEQNQKIRAARQS